MLSFKQVALAAYFLASAASASHLHERHVDVGNLFERGSYGGASAGPAVYLFEPTTQTAEGQTCAAAFGTGYDTCREATATSNRLCYNPNAGQVCCGTTWSCPNGSFCMTDGSCCPTGMDPASCGAKPTTTSSSSAAPSTTSSSSTWAPSSSSVSSGSHTKNHTSSVYSVKAYPTTFVNATASAGPTAYSAAVSSPGAAATSQKAVQGSAAQTCLSTAALICSGLLALLATF